jgi:hypothetical protein
VGTLSDASCPHCRKRFGWVGGPELRPACPRCGHQVDQSVIDNDARMMQDFYELLSERPTSTKDKTIRTRQRHSAGLSYNQALHLLGITREDLEAIESQAADPLPWLQQRMIDVYGLDPEGKK